MRSWQVHVSSSRFFSRAHSYLEAAFLTGGFLDSIVKVTTKMSFDIFAKHAKGLYSNDVFVVQLSQCKFMFIKIDGISAA